MSAPIGPGDWVECVRCGGHTGWYAPGAIKIVLGGVYCVEQVGEHRGPFLVLVGSHSTHATRGWDANAFRPIYRPRADFIESLKAPPKVALPDDQPLIPVNAEMRGSAPTRAAGRLREAI